MEEFSNTAEKSPITRWKRSDQSDAEHVSRLITKEVIKNYGEVEIHRLIEVCSASITLYNQDGNAVAFAALCDYPNIPAIMYSWPQWITNVYGLSHLNPLNTQFIHLMAFDYLYYPEFFPHVMEKIYMDNEYLDFIILLLPPRSICYDLLNMYFKRVHKLKDVPPEQIRACYVNNRWLHFGKFVLKKSDDSAGPITINIKRSKTNSNKPKYKKVIIQKDPFRTCIVEETPLAGDCICLNIKVNYSKLSEAYDLRTVNGFKCKARRDLKAASVPVKFAHPTVSGSVEHGFKPPKTPPQQFRTDSIFFPDGMSLFADGIEDNLRYEDVVLFDPGRLLSSIPIVTRQASFADQEGKLFGTRPFPPSMYISKPDANLLPPYLYESTIASQGKRKDFIGSGNAFAVELIMTYNKKARSIDYMRKIFEFSPDNLNFCLMELPFSASPPKILNYFYKLEKVDKSHPCDLYAAHLLAITGKMTVREAWPCDMEDIIGMTIGTHSSSNLVDLIHDICFKITTADEDAFVMLSENLIIGVAVVCPETRIDYLRSNFELDDLMCSSLNRMDEFGQVVHFIVSPLFYQYVRFFLKEIMRLTGYNALFFSLLARKFTKTMDERTWPCGLQRWVPIAPRYLAELPSPDERRIFNLYESKYGSEKPFSLFFMNRRIASMTLNLDNRDLLVVGHGITSMSFLEHLIYSKDKCYFNFGSIKLISPDSFVTCDNENFEIDYLDLIPSYSKYSLNYLDSAGIAAYTDHVTGRMTGINRERQTVEIDFKYELHYDYLFLLCGTQFTRPDMKKVVESETKMKVCSKENKGKTLEDYYSEDYPMNLCILDTTSDIDMFINFIIESYSQFTQEDYLVIYGGRINAWTCLNFLLKYIPGNEIAFVENLNETNHYVDSFNNPLIHQACKNAIINAEVKYYSSFVFSEWELKKQSSIISKINFIGDKSTLSLKCVSFVTFSPKTIHPITIMALNRSGLEFDGKLVIDHKFRTRDHRIYAAGSMTRYSKEYYYENFNHEHHNSTEVGAKLAEIFMEEACNESKQPEPEPEVPPLVEMTEPLIVSCVLPRNINYFKVHPPGRPYLFEQLASMGRIGKIMTTGDVFNPEGPDYFRILLDEFDKVMEITCFTAKTIDVVCLSRLYDKHEQLLNDLVWRYDNHMISDFYEFFRQPWASIIYHDRFKDFLSDIFPLHENIKDPDDKEKYLKLAKGLLGNDEKKKMIIKSKMMLILNKNGLDKSLCNSLMGFLEFNKELLPMYLTPSRLKVHAKDNYYMNQLLEPPIFAKSHLIKEQSANENSSTESLNSEADAVSKLLFSSSELTCVSEFHAEDFEQTVFTNKNAELKLTESTVKLTSSIKKKLSVEASSSSPSSSTKSSSSKSKKGQ